MSKFHTLLNKTYREIITEQEQPPVPAPAPEQAAPTPVPEIQQQPPAPTTPLTSEGETVLVRLLAKALLVDITDDVDEVSIKDMTQINAQNDKDALVKLVSIIRKYDPSIKDELDIDELSNIKV